ncbi:30S ribosomal protein S6 [Mesomycoplasma molare]|uniref:Small ribosomal subunit protein bS6 n=1 Tax=Mesomycoplasma molare TaxID=171288 RepID=A0ABY5TWM0_9BACT|nr:30S ribosomal protein S6 [Mesomycoplasma molare]UWD33986.1 30S ribosomal protein S6 [Mesomycoplasma molare]
MAKYEIMLILAPTEEVSLAEKIAKEVFKDGVKTVEKLERTELAYPINKSKTGTFVLINVESEKSIVAEFTRRTNIEKTIWRSLVVNLDSERGLNRKTKPKRRKLNSFKSNQFVKENNLNNSEKIQNTEESKVRKPRVKKTETEK